MQCWADNILSDSDDDSEWGEMQTVGREMFRGIGFYIKNILYDLIDRINNEEYHHRRKNESSESWLHRIQQQLHHHGKLWKVDKKDLCNIAKQYMEESVWTKENAQMFGTQILKPLVKMKKFEPLNFKFEKHTVVVKHLMNKQYIKNYHSVTKIATGGDHYLILTDVGRVFANGRNNFGQLGLPKIHLQYNGEVYATEQKNATDIACGFSTSFIIMTNGETYGTGSNLNGRLGIGKFSKDIFTWTQLLGPRMKRIKAGSIYGMGLGLDDYVYTWGSFMYSGHSIQMSATHRESGTPSPNDLFFPKKLNIGKALTISIGSGGYHSVVLAANGTVITWGHNRVGQLGIATSNSNQVVIPRPFTLPFPPFSIVHCEASWGNTLYIDQYKQCCIVGRNCSGQLGVDTTQTPETVNGTPHNYVYQKLLPDIANVKNIFITEQSVFVVYSDHTDIVGRAKRPLLNVSTDMHKFHRSNKRFIWKMNGHGGNSYYFYLQ